MGNVLSASLGQNPARQAAVGAGLPVEIGSTTINKVCGSGMKTVMLAANAIKAGEYEVIVAGGMENMNAAPYLLKQARFGYRLNDNKIVDHMVHDGLWDIFNDVHMGITAENVAEKWHITREQQDQFAVESHRRAISAHLHDGALAVRLLDLRDGETECFLLFVVLRGGNGHELLSDLGPEAREGIYQPNSAGLSPNRKRNRLPNKIRTSRAFTRGICRPIRANVFPNNGLSTTHATRWQRLPCTNTEATSCSSVT